jgi:hypothetical protein
LECGREAAALGKSNKECGSLAAAFQGLASNLTRLQESRNVTPPQFKKILPKLHGLLI